MSKEPSFASLGPQWFNAWNIISRSALQREKQQMKISAVVLLHINLFHLFIFFYHLTTARLHPPYLGISWHNNDPLPLDPRNHRQHCSAMHMINLNWERKVDLICATQLFQIKINLLQLAFAHSMAKFSSKIPNKHVHKANHRSLSEISKSAGTHNLHCTSAAHTSFPVSKAEEKNTHCKHSLTKR